MRLYDLKGLSDAEANELILKSSKVKLNDALENPEILSGKILVFRGNYDGFATDRLCIRTFEYLPKEEKWEVADATVYDMWISSFCYHFKSREVRLKFERFCEAEGFVMDA